MRSCDVPDSCARLRRAHTFIAIYIKQNTTSVYESRDLNRGTISVNRY